MSENPYQSPVNESPAIATPVSPAPGRFPIDFPRQASASWKVAGLLVFSALSLAFGLLMFLLHLFVIPRAGQLALHTTTTLPVLLSVFSFSGARSLMKTPQAVRVWGEGVEIFGRSKQAISFEQIVEVVVADQANPWGGPAKALRLLGEDGKPLAEIPGALERFDQLVERMQKSVRPPETTDGSPAGQLPDEQARKSGRRTALTCGAGAALLGLASVFIAYNGWWTRHAEQRMASEGVAGQGSVVRHFIAPNGVTRRIEYEVEGADGKKATHNVEIERTLHEQLAEGDAVSVRYVPGDPRISRLVKGEVEESDFLKTPLGSLLLSACSAVMTVFLLTMMFVSWRGYDIKFESGKLRLKPIGR